MKQRTVAIIGLAIGGLVNAALILWTPYYDWFLGPAAADPCMASGPTTVGGTVVLASCPSMLPVFGIMVLVGVLVFSVGMSLRFEGSIGTIRE